MSKLCCAASFSADSGIVIVLELRLRTELVMVLYMLEKKYFCKNCFLVCSLEKLKYCDIRQELFFLTYLSGVLPIKILASLMKLPYQINLHEANVCYKGSSMSLTCLCKPGVLDLDRFQWVREDHIKLESIFTILFA